MNIGHPRQFITYSIPLFPGSMSPINLLFHLFLRKSTMEMWKDQVWQYQSYMQ